ncbi:hypothetical protein GCM10029963_29820 [Micromonospora andamanensis]
MIHADTLTQCLWQGNNRSLRPVVGVTTGAAIGLRHDRPCAADPRHALPVAAGTRPHRPTGVRRQEGPRPWQGSHVQTPETIEKMRLAGRIAAQAVQLAGSTANPA